jgi:hypothetical protein
MIADDRESDDERDWSFDKGLPKASGSLRSAATPMKAGAGVPPPSTP